MSIAHNPGIVNDSLVFHYDMFNANKSYVGKESVNLIGDANDLTAAAWSKINVDVELWPFVEPLLDTVRPAYDDKDVRYFNIMENTTTNAQHMIGKTPAVSIGEVYTVSVFAKAKERTKIFLAMFGTAYVVFDLILGVVESDGGLPASIKSYGNGWYRCAATFTVPTTTAGVYTGIWNGSSLYTGTVGYGVLMSKFQYELNSYITPYCETSRTSAQTICDVVNSTFALANNMVYNSNNTFSFNGNTSFLDFNNNAAYSIPTAITMSSWIKPEAIPLDSSTGNIISKNGNLGYRFRFRNTTGATNTIESIINGASNLLVAPSNTFTVGAWGHVAVTSSSTGTKIYYNGQQVANNSIAFAPSDPSGGKLIVGAFDATGGETFKGQIAVASMYSRELSASEIKRNFNAMKGRFGL